MDCEICGRTKAWKRIKFENSIIIACDECSSFGTVIETPKAQQSNSQQKFNSVNSFNSTKPYSKEIREMAETIRLIDNYGTIVRKAREKSGLNIQEFSQKLFESPSVIQRIENQTLEPSEKLLQKLEKNFGIKLKEEKESMAGTLANGKKHTTYEILKNLREKKDRF